MTVLTADCPHCKAKNMTFTVFGAMVTAKNKDAGTVPTASVGAECRGCGLPIAAVYRANADEMHLGVFEQRINQALQMGLDLDDAYIIRKKIWPAPEATLIPEHLPPEVERAFAQGEANYNQHGCEEASALMYRRALEIGLKSAYPGQTGGLAARIKALVASHHLPASIGDWLDQVRLIGNEGAHEVDGVTRNDLQAARGFVDTALRYIFTLPAQVAERRGTPGAVA